jgi:hypothetical protein
MPEAKQKVVSLPQRWPLQHYGKQNKKNNGGLPEMETAKRSGAADLG